MNEISPYSAGQKIEGFIVKKIVKLPELQSWLYEIEHLLSGASILHIANDDPENVFCLAFKTLPKNSNGVPHILEHTVLCGSKKYPVKDPFFGMIRRSLNTFMNALTGSDFTCYPAASQVEKDFYNLLDVYLDAVFYPILNRLSFLQEGCRVEFEEMNNPKSPLIYKGIVFNEMKGSLSSADSRLWHVINETLMPNLPYAHNSGGDPKEIPSLTYEEFCAFHEECYHPSQCLFYFYGNIPLEKHLSFLEKNLLKTIVKSKTSSQIPVQPRFKKPLYKKETYPTHEKNLKNKTWISFSWLTTKIDNQQDLLGMTLLDSLLLDTDASPLKLALLQSGLCRQVEPLIDIEISEIPLHIICKGSEEKNADALEKIIFDTLKALEKTGFDKEMINSSLHQIEFSGTEITGDYYPFGLTLFFRSGLAKLHGCDPGETLLIHSQFEKLLELTKDPSYLTTLMKRYLIDNPHFVRVVLTPDPKLESLELEKEKKILAEMKASLDDKKTKEILKQREDLEAFQEKLEHSEIDCLPKLSLNEIPKKTHFFALNKKETPFLTAYHHPCFTNHITYVDLISSLPKLTKEELLYTRLFTLLFSEVGTENRTYTENLEELQAYTGGVGCALGIHSQCNTPDIIKPALHLRGKALSRNTEKLFSLMNEMMRLISFKEKARVKEIILQIFTEMQQKLNKGSLSYATDLALCNNSIPTKLHHLWYGFGFYKFLEQLVENLDDNLPSIINHLTNLKHKLFHHQHLDLVISCSKEHYLTIEKANYYGMSQLDRFAYTPWESHFEIETYSSHARKISSPVAFTCMGTKTICAPNPISPFITLASTLMQNKILHKKIREQGGAYGSGSAYNIINGNFTMYSYRDPHIASTLSAFEEAIKTISEEKFTEADLEEAKFLIIQNIDAPVSPGLRATDSYSQIRENLRLDLRQAFREKILTATTRDIALAVKDHLSDFTKKGKIVSFCGESLLKKEETLIKNKLPIFSI